MKLHPVIANALVGALVAFQAWTLHTLNNLQIRVAQLDQEFRDKIAAVKAPAAGAYEVTDTQFLQPTPVAHGAQLLTSTPK